MSVYKRGRIWWVRFECGRQEIRRSSRSSLKRVAEQYEAELRSEFARLNRGGKPRHTYNDVMARFVREHFPTLKPGAAKRYGVSIKALTTEFDGKYIDGIDRTLLADFVSKRKRSVKDPTILRDLACLSSALSCAVDWGMIDHNILQILILLV